MKTVLLGDLVDIKSGKSRPRQNGKFPVYGGNGIFDSSPEANMKEPAVILGRVGAYCGSVYFEELPFWLSDNALGVTAKTDTSLRFIYYLLKSINLNNRAVGGAQPLLTQGIVNNIHVKVPSHEDQNKIADILGKIDEKIELNRRMNETLEKLGQALFKHYFIDNPEAKNWPNERLGEFLKVERGLSYKGKYLSEKSSDIPMINLGSIDLQGEYSPGHIKYYNGDYKDRNVVQPGDLVLANTDMTQDRVILGSIIIVPDIASKILYSHHISALKELKLPKNFVYYLLKRPVFRSRAQGFATGTTVLALPESSITTLPFNKPPKDILAEFEEIALGIMKYKDILRKENYNLNVLRDTLLPRLISGKIKV